MKTFKDLEFITDTEARWSQAVINFENGYGASIVQHPNSYGGNSDLYELAVLKDTLITYKTPITNDVLGWLNEKDIDKVLIDIQNLKKN